MRQAFQISASVVPWSNQPLTEKVIIVSTSASDGSKNLVLQGTVSASPDNETVTLGSEGRIEKESTKTFSALVSATLGSSAAGTVNIYGQGNAASGTVIVSTNPAVNDTLTVGLVGNTQVYRFVSTLSAANDVFIGATVSDTASNLNKAINDTGTEGTNYGTGTTINEYLSSTVSGAIVTITDKIACDRYLGWTMTQSGTGLSLSAPTGGLNGTLLGSIGVGTTGIQDAFTLDNETLDAATANFPGTITPTFDAIFVGGAPFRVYAARGTGSNVVFKIMGGHSSDTCTEEILTGLTAGSATYEVKPAVATPAYSGFEYIKPVCTSNGNSSPIQLAAYVVSG